MAAIFVAAALDLVDGAIARYMGTVSKLGAILDLIADSFMWNVLFFLAASASGQKYFYLLLVVAWTEATTTVAAIIAGCQSNGGGSGGHSDDAKVNGGGPPAGTLEGQCPRPTDARVLCK